MQQNPLPPALVTDRRVFSASWPLLLIMALMLILSLLSVQIVSWTRSYAHGHALWAIAENRAMYELRGYAQTGDEAHYQRFLDNLTVPLADRVARLQLQGDDPDYDLVRRSFRAGGVPAEDIPGLIYLFHLFHFHPYMIEAVDRWAEADTLVVELAAVGESMHGEFARAPADAARIRALSAHADRLHQRIESPLREFGTIMGDAARQIVLLLLIALPLCAAALVAVGIAIGRALNRRADKAASALRVLSRKLAYQASHDSLTGLTNRPQFEVLLAEAIGRPRGNEGHGALMYFDLDQFKVVNDTSGHAAGDELIKQVAWRIRRVVGDNGTLARLGGDEFGVLIQPCGFDVAVQLAERVREQVRSLRFTWQQKVFAVSASIGVLALDESIPSVADALSAADHACYLAKENGRDRVQVYRADDQQVQTRTGEMQWVERLQQALEGEGFLLVAQEIRHLSMQSGAAHLPAPPRRKFELLLRIAGAGGQMIAPMAFIPAAERYGLMPRIDRWVIARACLELAALRAEGIPLPVFLVNLSGASASDPGLAEYIAGCLQEHGLDASHIGVELTETAAVGNLENCSQLMARLRTMGCLIALDDFGTGMSSFSYLRNLPIDLLKIDRTFISRISGDAIDHALVETIQRIAGIMGVRTVAEGVETEEVLASLALIGVDFAQGCHLGRPAPIRQFYEPAAVTDGNFMPAQPAMQTSTPAEM